MKHLTTVFMAGFVFALGLGVSGMTNADKVIGFLNLAGSWDPSLAFVMVAAIGTHLAFYGLILKRNSPLFGDRFQIPSRTDIDGRLIAGSAMFGVGWGLGGFCPGPGIVSSVTLGAEAAVFVTAMIGGMWLFKRLNQTLTEGSAAGETPTSKSPATA
jgi:hypothetical protein